MSNLECSSRGDKRFSAVYAKVKMFGRLDSIEKHYQSVKFTGGSPSRKGQRVDYIQLGSHTLDPRFLTPLYKILWVRYLDSNPELVEYAEQYDTFSDMFRGKSINCQADVVRDYVKLGRSSVLADCTELIDLLGINI